MNSNIDLESLAILLDEQNFMLKTADLGTDILKTVQDPHVLFPLATVGFQQFYAPDQSPLGAAALGLGLGYLTDQYIKDKIEKEKEKYYKDTVGSVVNTTPRAIGAATSAITPYLISKLDPNIQGLPGFLRNTVGKYPGWSTIALLALQTIPYAYNKLFSRGDTA